MLIDTHTHTQPTAVDKSDFDRWAGAQDRSHAGCLDDLLESMHRAGIAQSMIVPWLPAQQIVDTLVGEGADRDTSMERVIKRWSDLNSWAAASVQAHPQELACLVGLDPVLMSPATLEAEVKRGLTGGAIGIKVAPMFLSLHPDDEAMEVVWRLARDHDVFVLSEACATPGLPGFEAWGHPKHFDEVCRSYPGVSVQLAHLGVGGETEVARLTSRYSNVFADLSMRLGGPVPIPFSPAETLQHIRAIGVDRILFGTNYPLVGQGSYVSAFRDLGLNEDEQQAISSENAKQLYGRK
jgi:predicted TIM-barrel fold metal-dependent hydrolase